MKLLLKGLTEIDRQQNEEEAWQLRQTQSLPEQPLSEQRNAENRRQCDEDSAALALRQRTIGLLERTGLEITVATLDALIKQGLTSKAVLEEASVEELESAGVSRAQALLLKNKFMAFGSTQIHKFDESAIQPMGGRLLDAYLEPVGGRELQPVLDIINVPLMTIAEAAKAMCSDIPKIMEVVERATATMMKRVSRVVTF